MESTLLQLYPDPRMSENPSAGDLPFSTEVTGTGSLVNYDIV